MSSSCGNAFRIVPMILIMGTIFFLSHQPGDNIPLPPLWNIDKLAHMVMYGILSGSVIFSFLPTYRRKAPLVVSVVSVFLSALYGLSDEFHQSFIPLRQASWADIVADTCGALLVANFWLLNSRRNFEKCGKE